MARDALWARFKLLPRDITDIICDYAVIDDRYALLMATFAPVDIRDQSINMHVHIIISHDTIFISRYTANYCIWAFCPDDVIDFALKGNDNSITQFLSYQSCITSIRKLFKQKISDAKRNALSV